MDFTQIVIVIVFFLLNNGHEAENLQKECLFLLYCLHQYSFITHLKVGHHTQYDFADCIAHGR